MDRGELKEILIAVLVITLAFTMANWARTQRVSELPLLFFIALVSVGTGFVFHELAHRAVARHYGAFAAFKAWTTGLALALMTSVFGIVFAAPGAVYIFGRHLSVEQNGKISLAGPLVNLALALVFFALLVVAQGIWSVETAAGKFASSLAASGFYINAWLGLFNMLPLFPLDGEKILRWNPLAWAATAGILFLLVFSPSLLLNLVGG
ncbi:MAG: site-2 protease family protein [Candidatus Micrarchaeota archaeon]